MRKETFSSFGVVAASFLSASCCIGPAIFIIFGTSVVFLSRLSFMKPMRPFLLGAALIPLGYSFWKLYLRKANCNCVEDIRVKRLARVIFWIGAAALAFAFSFQSIIIMIYS